MRSLTSIGVVLVVLLLLFMGGCSSYNGFVDAEEDVDRAWADVQTQYERRASLIPNLVATVKGASENEKDILIGVTDARTGASAYKELINKAQTPSELQGVGDQILHSSMLADLYEIHPNICLTVVPELIKLKLSVACANDFYPPKN